MHALKLLPGCNTPPEVTRAQLEQNISRDLPWLSVEEEKGRPLAIVAGGPSLKDTYKDVTGDILALNGAYGFLMERGVRPDYFMLLDARAENVDFLAGSKDTTHYIAGQCHPDVFDALEGFKTVLYLTTLPDVMEVTKGIDKPKVQLAGPVGTVGMKALSLGYALGYREFHLYGYDSSYAGSAHHAFPQKLNDSANTIEIILDGVTYITTPTLAHQVQEFPGFAKELIQLFGCDINVHGYGLLNDYLALANKEGERPLEDREREKYTEVWKHDKYREVAPGEFSVDDAIYTLKMEPGDSVIDFGCGTGRAAKKFQEMGYRVTAVDFAENCLETNVPFVRACLWDLPRMKADWGYCTDVMEHIPREKVMDVLRAIKERCGGAYFKISTHQDNLGALIGRRLHMTVMDGKAWHKAMQSVWEYVEWSVCGEDAIFKCI